jgi:Fe2+ or Zn2+ uptake regulation protein
MIKDELSLGDLGQFLKKSGLKITPTRLAILKIFSKNDKPISADFIFNKLKEKINEVTVYRTLASFEKSGILRRVDLRRDSIYFELNNDHHHHMVCIKCGVIEDFQENKEIEESLDNIIKKSVKFKNIKEHSLEVFGICRVCN